MCCLAIAAIPWTISWWRVKIDLKGQLHYLVTFRGGFAARPMNPLYLDFFDVSRTAVKQWAGSAAATPER